RGACLRARGLVAALQAVVAEGALPDASILLVAEQRQLQRPLLHRPGRQLSLVEHAERTGGYAVAAAVADVLLDDDGSILRAEEGSGRADVEARRMRAVLADVGAHQPAQRVPGIPVDGRLLPVEAQRLVLFDERDVAPAVGAELRGVVVRLAGPHLPVLGDQVPLLAGDLAGLAADADRGVREDAHPGLRLVPVRIGPGRRRAGDPGRAHVFPPSSGSTRGASARAEAASARRPATNCVSLLP